MKLYLVRHAATQAPSGLCYGHSDIPLNPAYPRQHQQIKQHLPPAERIYTSPLSRCHILATFLAGNQPIIVDERLKELNFGLWEQQQFNHINPHQLKFWTENHATHAPPQGETFTQLYQRCQQFWHTILLNRNANNTIIVTHAGVIRALLALSLNLPIDTVFHFKVDYGSIHCLKRHKNWIELIYWNQTVGIS